MPEDVRHCAWLSEDGVICDQPLSSDELFCATHPNGPHFLLTLNDGNTSDSDPLEVVANGRRGRRVHAPARPAADHDQTGTTVPVAEPAAPVVDPVILRPAVIDQAPVPRRPRGELESAYHEALCGLGQQSTPDGLLVCYLARQLDDGLTPTAISQVAARLMMAADKVFAGRLPTVDALDELQARRRRRAANDD